MGKSFLYNNKFQKRGGCVKRAASKIFTFIVLGLFLFSSVTLAQEEGATDAPAEEPAPEETKNEEPPQEQTQEPSQEPTSPDCPCKSGDQCVPCPGEEQSREDFNKPVQNPEGTRTSCPQPPTPKCGTGYKAEAVFDDKGCITNHECISTQGSDNVPQGCTVEVNEFGNKFVKCQDDKFSQGKQDAERRCRADGGHFFIREDGSFECSFEGQQGFFSGSQCLDGQQMKERIDRCKESGGQVEQFRDRNGCEAVSCRQQGFEFENEEDKIKGMSYGCESSGWQFTITDQGPRCIGGEERFRISSELRPLDGVDLLRIALQLEETIQTFHEISDKLQGLSGYYDNRGDQEKAESFKIASSQLSGVINRLDEIRQGLAEKADSLTEQDRIEVLEDIKRVKSILKEVAITILTGKRAKTSSFEEGTQEFHDEQQDRDIFKAFQQCADFSEDSPFTFSPERNIQVSLNGLDDQGRCIMKIMPPEFPEGMTMYLPSEVYQFFNGPHLLLRDDVECTPDIACEMMFKQLESESQQQQRFGERPQDFQPEEESPRDFSEFPRDDFRPQGYDDFNQRSLDDFSRIEDEFGSNFQIPNQQQRFNEPNQYRSPQEFNEFQDYRRSEEQQYLEERHPEEGYCGDNTVAPSLGEECDDGNSQSGDGCSANCREETEPIVANVIKNFGNVIRGDA